MASGASSCSVSAFVYNNLRTRFGGIVVRTGNHTSKERAWPPCWATTEGDMERSQSAILRIAAESSCQEEH